MYENFRDLDLTSKFNYFKAKVEKSNDRFGCLMALDDFARWYPSEIKLQDELHDIANTMYPTACFERYCKNGETIQTTCKF